ncbi:MAG: sugar phosphate isomerase/epimerase [Bacteroidales bacterium]|nr:sugar phosphate isomerase/epimerase [Bacteroidales bacterium]
MSASSRRKFIKVTSLGVASATFGSLTLKSEQKPINTKKIKPGFELGIASYTFRKFTLNETLVMTNRLNIKNLSLKSMHLPYESSAAEITAAINSIQEAGINLYGGGVIYMNTEDELNKGFEYAKTAGMSMIIGVPAHELLEKAEKKVKEYNIKLAIHNHGPGDKLYPTAESVYEKVKNMDNRMGMCLDIGHEERLGLDPALALEKFVDRIFDIHIKDVTASTPEGTNIEIGRGVINIPAFLKMVKKLGYSGKVAFEFEKDENDPLPGLAESVGYVRGILDLI